MKGFSEMFAPFDENYASELAEKLINNKGKEDNLLSMEQALPAGIDPVELEKL